jgi:putative ABC transport system permease protein
MGELLQDLKYGWRGLVRNPGFALMASLTLALGIGATSAIFSFVDGVLLKPLPYRDADQIVQVWEQPPGGGRNVISTENFLDWRAQSTVFSAMAAGTGGSMTLTGLIEPVLLRTGRVSAGYFDVWGVAPLIGRTFAPDEDQPGKDHVVVLSHVLWQTQFGSDPNLLNKTLTLNGEPYTVIGVMPGGTPFDRGSSRLWRPLAFASSEKTRDFHWLTAIARLKSSVTIDQARRELRAIGGRIAEAYPASNKGWGVTVDRYADEIVGDRLRQSLYVLLAAVGMLLLIGCANLANLTLARGMSREREVAVRASIGASRGRLVRQFLTENVLLAVIGGVLGVGLGYALMAALAAALPPQTLPREAHVAMDARALAFTFALSVVTGLLFGLAPALHATSPDLTDAMKEGGRGATADTGRRRLRSALVVAEIALAFLLLIGAGLLMRSFSSMMTIDLGTTETNVLTMSLPISDTKFPDVSGLRQYYRELVARVDAVPGVRSSAITASLPIEGFGYGMPFLIAGSPDVDLAHRPACGFTMVGPSYFQTVGMQVVKGRVFTDRDTKATPPVAVINEDMVSTYFKGVEPLGQHILVQEIVAGRPELGPIVPWEVIGVVRSERGLNGRARAGMYVPMEQDATTYVSLAVQGAVDAATLEQSIRRAIYDVDHNQPVSDVRTLTQLKTESAAPDRLRTWLIEAFAVVALLLAAVGIYGVLAYSVAQRTHEIGIRAALGASTGAILRMVLGHGALLVAAGLAIGGMAAAALTRFLTTLLFGVTAHDSLTMSVAAVVLTGVALIACYVPARRAAKTDPLLALRRE